MAVAPIENCRQENPPAVRPVATDAAPYPGGGAPRREYEMAQAVTRNAKVPVVDVRRAVVQDAFRSSKWGSRFDIAKLISERYPELHPRLPAKRKLTENEPFQLRMFNAAAVGMAFRRLSHRKAHEV